MAYSDGSSSYSDGRYNQDSFVYFAKACSGWVFASVNGVVCVDVK